MSRRVPWYGALLSMFLATPLAGQVPGIRGLAAPTRPLTAPSESTPLAERTEAELLRMIDSLAPLVEQAAAEAETARLARMRERRAAAATRDDLDTISVTGLTVIAPASEADLARELFGEVWDESFRGLQSRSVREHTFTFQSATYEVAEIPVDGIRSRVVVPAWHSRDRAKARIRNALGRAIAADLDETTLRQWTGGNPFARSDPSGIYREMIVARSAAVRRCLAGDVDACTSSLGLRLDDGVISSWYTPEERRERVLAWAGIDATVAPATDRGGVPPATMDPSERALDDCARLVIANACDDFIQPDRASWAPLPAYLRATLVALAIDRGGAGAWARLVEAPSMPPAEALAHAAGVPLEDLVAEWRTWVVSNRPEAYAGLGGYSALAVLWILFFTGLATRSTRWRFD